MNKQLLNNRFTLLDICHLMAGKTVSFDQATFLTVSEFKLIPHENTVDIIGIGSNDDHYIGTISGLNYKALLKLI